MAASPSIANCNIQAKHAQCTKQPHIYHECSNISINKLNHHQCQKMNSTG